MILPKPKPSLTGEEDGDNFEDILLDQTDCSITLSERYLLELTKYAGLDLNTREVQAKFPKEIFPVITYAFDI